MAEESNAAPANQALHQGLVDLRQTWEHLARELASGVPELPGVIDQELAGIKVSDLNEETLIRVTEAVVARVAAAGFPDEAAVLLRRMGRAMYELLLLLATQEEIREMNPPAFAPEASGPQLTVLRPPDEDGLVPFDLLEVAPEPEEVLAPPPEHWASRDGKVASTDSPVPLPVPPAADRPPAPRDPVRPAAVGNGSTAVPAAAFVASHVHAPPPVVEVAAPVAPVRRPPAAPVTLPPAPELPTEPSPEATLPPLPAQQPAPIPSPVQAQAPPPPPPPPPLPSPPATAIPAEGVAPATAAPSPPPTPRELTADEAPLWGFDPATREVVAPEQAAEEAVPPAAQPPVADQVAETNAAAPAVEEKAPVPESPAVEPPTPVEQDLRSGWTVRLSPRRATEQERKLAARELEMPPLIQEIVATAQSQQEALSARGNARRVLAAAQERAPLTAAADPASEIKAMLEAGQLEDAATMAVQMARSSPGEESAAVACAVGEEVRQAKHLELAVLCFTTAVLCAAPCDRACWQLCTLSVERRDATMAPIWLEFVARLLRARGADLDAISVYRQLLKLSPRRADIRELLRVSSLIGQLPN